MPRRSLRDNTPDMKLPGMLHGRVLRPDRFNAKLVSLDASAAKAMNGVTVVRDGDFVGVTAMTTSAASSAVGAFKAEWNAPEQTSSKTLYSDLRKTRSEGGRGGGGRGGMGETGSVDKAMAEADKKLERTYTVAYIAHAPLEPRAAVAQWTEGKLTVWMGTQRPFAVRDDLAGIFHVPEKNVRVIVPDTGSAYGGKHTRDAGRSARFSPSARRSRRGRASVENIRRRPESCVQRSPEAKGIGQ